MQSSLSFMNPCKVMKLQVRKNYHISVLIINTEEGFSLAKIFKQLEDQKDALEIEDYSVSQTTLEQIFLNMTKPNIKSY